MANTARLGLPLLQAAQAQKHVTVNEALVRLDGLGQLSLLSLVISVPPVLADDGDCYGIPGGAANEWAGHVGEIAIRSNGGWVYAVPLKGWRAWVVEASVLAVFDGQDWIEGAVALSGNGAATIHEVLEIDHVVTAGATNVVAAAIPSGSMVIGITGRVLSGLSGTLTGWRVGVATSDDRYGSFLGLGQGSWVRGMTSGPLTYYADTDLLLTGEAGDFVDGEVRLAVHLMRLGLPSA